MRRPRASLPCRALPVATFCIPIRRAIPAGRWPKTEEVMQAFEDLTWQTPIGPVTMRADHQAVHAGIVGLSKMSPQLGFAVMAQLKEMSADQIMPPVGVKSSDWLKTLK